MDEIFEQADFTIKARITTGLFGTKPYTGTFDLVADIDGTPTTFEKDKKVGGDGTYTTKYKPRLVKPDEKNYLLKIIAQYGKGKSSSTTIAKARVWPKVVKIHAKNLKDKNYPGFDFKVEQSGADPIPLTTQAPDGKVEVTLTRPAGYKITCEAPFEILENIEKKDKLREHELKVVHNIKARFISPDVTTMPYVVSQSGGDVDNGVRQYVNLESDNADKDGTDAMGSEVTCTVEADDSGPSPVPGKEGDPIYIRVTFGRQSKRNKPEPALDQTGVEAYEANDKKTVHKGYVLLGADLKAKFKLKLGLAGGDTCKVEIGGTRHKYTDARLTLVNWRKLWYETRYPDAMASRLASGDFKGDLRTNIHERLSQVFVDYEMSEAHNYADSDCTVAAKGGVLKPAAFFKETGADQLVVSNFLLQVPGDAFSDDAAKKSRTIYVSLCDRAFSTNAKVLPDVIAPRLTAKEAEYASPSDELMEPSVKDGTPIFKVSGGTPVAKYKWSAVLANPHMKEPKLTVNSAPDTAAAVAGKVSIATTRGMASSLDVTFPVMAPGFETTLADSNAIDTWVDASLGDAVELRKCGNELVLKITSLDGPEDLQRFNAVKAAVEARFNATKAPIKYHPGLDENGNPREGEMDAAWFEVTDYLHYKVKLPASPGGTADYLRTQPGDMAGAESDTQCPVRIMFQLETAYEINGNSGSGAQLMVLRDTLPGPCSSTVCHELGHAMGMTIVTGKQNDLLPPGLTAKHVDNGGNYYVDERDVSAHPITFDDGRRDLHRGGHCAYGISDANRDYARFHGWEPTRNGCIMWGSGADTDSRPKFCPTCADLLKARRLTDIRTTFAGRGADQG